MFMRPGSNSRQVGTALTCCVKNWSNVVAPNILDRFGSGRLRWTGRMMAEPKASKRSCRSAWAGWLGLVPAVAALGILTVVASDAAELNSRDMILLDRLTWGINASSAAHLQAVGWERWLGEQLHPASTAALPEVVRKQIEAMPDVHKLPFDIAVAFDAQAKSANQVAD